MTNRDKLPKPLQSLDWQPMTYGLQWYDGTELLVAVPSGKKDEWAYCVDVVTVNADEDYFAVECNSEPWGWDLQDAEWYVVIRGQKPEASE